MQRWSEFEWRVFIGCAIKSSFMSAIEMTFAKNGGQFGKLIRNNVRITLSKFGANWHSYLMNPTELKGLRTMLVCFEACCILCIMSNFYPLQSKPTACATSLTLRSCKIQV